ncbi:MAG: CoA-binding protein [Methanobacteriota archaeon]|nr:MAG: CoA-binding protein [Euryarchaeota archaeon]
MNTKRSGDSSEPVVCPVFFGPQDTLSDEQVREILQLRNIAVVGLSTNPRKPSRVVAEYLESRGYKIIPVNPKKNVIMGKRAYPSLEKVSVPVDIVAVFLPPEKVLPLVEQAARIDAKVFWMQEQVVNPEAAEKAREKGLVVAMNRCLKKEYQRLFEGKKK